MGPPKDCRADRIDNGLAAPHVRESDTLHGRRVYLKASRQERPMAPYSLHQFTMVPVHSENPC